MPAAATATLGAAVAAMARAFRAAGLDSPGLDARRLAAFALAIDPMVLVREPERVLGAEALARLTHLAERRLAREPVSRIVGERTYRGLAFEIGPATLDPRPETETLVEVATSLYAAEGGPTAAAPRIIDLGTGSGAILIALLLAWPRASGIGVDIDADALAVAARNAARHGVAGRAGFRRSSWLDAVDDSFDIVVSNPPYIPSREIAGLDPEVALHDPHGALDGGGDGLDAYRAIAEAIGRALRPGGWCVLEVGAGQSEQVLAIFRAVGLGIGALDHHIRHDLGGVARCVAVRSLSHRNSGGSQIPDSS